MSVAFQDTESGGTSLALEMREFKLKQLQVQAPPLEMRRISSMAELSISSSPDTPLVSMRSGGDRAASMSVALDSLAMKDLSGDLIVEDTAGRPVELTLGWKLLRVVCPNEC